MSLSKLSEQSPLLGEYEDVQNVLANGKSHDHGEGGLPCRDEQPSNASLALIMGSIWGTL